MNRRERRRAARGGVMPSREEFERELRAVVDGRPADPNVSRFWDRLAASGDVVAAITTDDGIAVIRDRKDGAR